MAIVTVLTSRCASGLGPAALLLVFLGLLMSLVREMKIKRRSHPNCLGICGGKCLGTGPNVVVDTGMETQHCKIVAGDLCVPLPAWTQVIKRVL